MQLLENVQITCLNFISQTVKGRSGHDIKACKSLTCRKGPVAAIIIIHCVTEGLKFVQNMKPVFIVVWQS